MDLKERIEHKYDSISTHVKVKKKKRSLGEIDLIAKNGSKIDLYEVKCSHRVLKAKKQLNKMKRLLNLEKSRAYFYCGSSRVLMVV